VAGDVQAPSGTGFDPSPQFWVDRVELDGPPLAVTGRCFFGPVGTGLVFDGVVPGQDGGWPAKGLVACRLHVAEVYVFGRLAEEVDQVVSARLVLNGTGPACPVTGSVLVARGQAGNGWRLQGGLWRR
jgi:hypothetical protein